MARNPRFSVEASPNNNAARPVLASRHQAWNILGVVLAIAVQSHYRVRTAPQCFAKATPQCRTFATLPGLRQHRGSRGHSLLATAIVRGIVHDDDGSISTCFSHNGSNGRGFIVHWNHHDTPPQTHSHQQTCPFCCRRPSNRAVCVPPRARPWISTTNGSRGRLWVAKRMSERMG